MNLNVFKRFDFVGKAGKCLFVLNTQLVVGTAKTNGENHFFKNSLGALRVIDDGGISGNWGTLVVFIGCVKG